MSKHLLLLGTFAFGLAATSPAHAFLNDREDFGTLLGAISGGFIGNEIGQGDGRVIATAVGAVGGSLLGRNIGQSLDRSEYTYARSYGYDRPHYRGYHNYSNYNYYEPRPVLYSAPAPQVVYVAPSYEQRVGSYSYAAPKPYCREYVNAVTVGNRVQEGYGTACLQPDGSWQVQSR